MRVKGLVDTTWGSDLNDRKSINGLLLTVGGCTVDWTSKKQKSVAKSSSEAEYVGTSNGGSGVKFENMLLQEMMGSGHVQFPSVLGVDTMGAIYMSKNDVTGPRTKHIDIHFHFIKDMVRYGELDTRYVHTSLNTSDILTKNLPEGGHTKHAKDINNGRYVESLGAAPSFVAKNRAGLHEERMQQKTTTLNPTNRAGVKILQQAVPEPVHKVKGSKDKVISHEVYPVQTGLDEDQWFDLLIGTDSTDTTDSQGDWMVVPRRSD